MTSKPEGPVGGPGPSSVACPGSPGADLPAQTSGAPEPVPGLLAYLLSRRGMHFDNARSAQFKAADKRSSPHTRGIYLRSVERHTAEIARFDGFIEAYRKLYQ